jgi:uncharacterized protein YndB with AHSA1/START domain
MNINRHRPIVGRQSVVIRAPVEAVWSLLTDIDRWVHWNPDIRHAELRGSLTQGAIFHWEFGGRSLWSRIHEVMPLRKLAWSGQAGMVVTLQVWTLVPIEDGVSVQVEMSWEGLSAPSETRDLQRAIETLLTRWLTFLRDDVEGRVRYVQYVLKE